MQLIKMSTPFSFAEPYWIGPHKLTAIQEGDRSWIVPYEYVNEIPRIYNMELRKDDVWLSALPKTGSTWASEMIYSIYHGVKKAAEIDHFDRWALPEMSAYDSLGKRNLPPESKADALQLADGFQHCVDMPSPRFIRTHIPLPLLPPHLLDTCKVIYCFRNFKDASVSYFNQFTETSYVGSSEQAFADYIHHVISDKAWMSPLCEGVKEAWNKRNHPNMYFLFYEEMKKDLPAVIQKMAKFLGTTLTEEQAKEVEQHLSIENLRDNKNFNMEWRLKSSGLMGKNQRFVRKGIVGDWKNYFTPELNEVWDQWWNKHMADSDFKFPE